MEFLDEGGGEEEGGGGREEIGGEGWGGGGRGLGWRCQEEQWRGLQAGYMRRFDRWEGRCGAPGEEVIAGTFEGNTELPWGQHVLFQQKAGGGVTGGLMVVIADIIAAIIIIIVRIK